MIFKEFESCFIIFNCKITKERILNELLHDPSKEAFFIIRENGKRNKKNIEEAFRSQRVIQGVRSQVQEQPFQQLQFHRGP